MPYAGGCHTNRQRIAPVPVELIDGRRQTIPPLWPEGWSNRAALAVVAELARAQAEAATVGSSWQEPEVYEL